jgi:hypothetical protein
MEWYLLFGHLFGDYLLQTAWMAYHKKINFLACFVHCCLYTAAVCLFLMACPDVKHVTLSLAFFIFMSHWIIDRYELLDWWFKTLNIRSWNSFEGTLEDPAAIHQAVSISFGALVYTVADNTLHLFLMWVLLNKYYI